MTNIIVKKYGGTSLASPQHINNIAAHLASNFSNPLQQSKLVIVVSAMAGVTDRLVGYSQAVNDNYQHNNASDTVLASGEQITAGLMSLALNQHGIKAVVQLGWQIPITTSLQPGNSRITNINNNRLLDLFNDHSVIVVPGFQGLSSSNNITTLGRGGSDITAVALAISLNASSCEIQTDVAGVMSADPNIVNDAKLLPLLNYQEMLEFACSGAKVLHSRAAMLAYQYQQPLLICSSLNTNTGTIVNCSTQLQEQHYMEQHRITGVTSNNELIVATINGISDNLKLITKLFDRTTSSGFNLKIIDSDQTQQKLRLVFKNSHQSQFDNIINELKYEINYTGLSYSSALCDVTIIANHINQDQAIIGEALALLSDQNIEIYNITSSDIKISFLIDQIYAELAIRKLHNHFLTTTAMA